MKVSELRKGCWVKAPCISIHNPSDYFRVDGIDAENVIEYKPSEYTTFKVPLHRLEGIPLTEDILLGSGFEKVGFNYVIAVEPPRIFPFVLTYCKDSNVFFFEFRNQTIRVDYFHQLQNICFALLGRELEFGIIISNT